ncbi:MAG TPA: FHA domain-containing protein [Polyangia bacterium]|nr:FHA domain-containing protein [Polyangia bacterium]
MANDPTRKTLRHFYCRDVLWQSFERMSEALDRGVDELVNEAMRVLAQQQGFLPPDFVMSSGSGLSRPEPGLPRPDARTGSGLSQSDAQAGSGLSRTGRRAVPPPLPAGRATAEQSANRPPPLPAAASFSVPAQTGGGAAPPLYLIFGNQRYAIDKEQFIIGRGTKSSDLPIRDGNISRKHAAVIRRNGEYYIKDLGSTNGIDFKGERIEGKKIEEGDVFSICEYQLKFTFR